MSGRKPPMSGQIVHLIGDIQGIPYQASRTHRAAAVVDDCNRPTVPDVDLRIQVGDFISSGPDSNFAPTVNFCDSLGQAGQWFATIGNHDHDREGIDAPANVRTPDEAAALMGMPAANHVVDAGFATFVFFHVWAWGGSRLISSDYTWLASAIDSATSPVFIVAHPALRSTITKVGLWAEMLADDDTTIRGLIDSRPNVKGWFCGHTHSPLIHPVAKMVNTGTREIAQVNGSALLNESPNVDPYDPIRSVFLSFRMDANEMDVRFRDHGAHQWYSGGPKSERIITLPI